MLAGCDRMISPRSTQLVRDAQRKAAEGEYIAAINLYENALDGSPGSAAIHYELALLYDDKMQQPLNALHHFKRYLTLAPGGTHAAEAKRFMQRDELALVTELSGDSIVTRAEAVRLRNENLSLRRQLEERGTTPRAVTARPEKPTRGASSPAAPRDRAARSHTVEAGDTLFSLSRKYYNSPDRWKDILEANKKEVQDPGKLKIGQTLVIP